MPADLVQLAEERSYDALEGAWLEAVEAAGRSDIAPFLEAADPLGMGVGHRSSPVGR